VVGGGGGPQVHPSGVTSVTCRVGAAPLGSHRNRNNLLVNRKLIRILEGRRKVRVPTRGVELWAQTGYVMG